MWFRVLKAMNMRSKGKTKKNTVKRECSFTKCEFHIIFCGAFFLFIVLSYFCCSQFGVSFVLFASAHTKNCNKLMRLLNFPFHCLRNIKRESKGNITYNESKMYIYLKINHRILLTATRIMYFSSKFSIRSAHNSENSFSNTRDTASTKFDEI